MFLAPRRRSSRRSRPNFRRNHAKAHPWTRPGSRSPGRPRRSRSRPTKAASRTCSIAPGRRSSRSSSDSKRRPRRSRRIGRPSRRGSSRGSWRGTKVEARRKPGVGLGRARDEDVHGRGRPGGASPSSSGCSSTARPIPTARITNDSAPGRFQSSPRRSSDDWPCFRLAIRWSPCQGIRSRLGNPLGAPGCRQSQGAFPGAHRGCAPGGASFGRRPGRALFALESHPRRGPDLRRPGTPARCPRSPRRPPTRAGPFSMRGARPPQLPFRQIGFRRCQSLNLNVYSPNNDPRFSAGMSWPRGRRPSMPATASPLQSRVRPS